MKNPLGFPHEKGSYEVPEIVISGGHPIFPLPARMVCGGRIVIYSSWVELVPSCAGYSGLAAGNNSVVGQAVNAAHAAAAKIACNGTCEKSVVEIWRAWDCGSQPPSASGAVEVIISCSKT